MSDTLKIYGNTYTGIESIKAEDPNGNELIYIRPAGTLAITSNSSSIDVTEYATVSVDVAGGSGSGITVIESIDSHGGTIVDIYGEPIAVTLGTKNITENGTYSAATDSYDGYSTVDIAVPNVFTITDTSNTTGITAVITAGTSGGGATAHEIHLEFTDSTDEDIDVYYDDSWIGSLITSTAPTSYGQKTISLAQLDNVTWYELGSIPLNTELIDSASIVSDYIIGSDGSEQSEQWYCASDYTVIAPGMTFSFTGCRWFHLAFYDSSKTFISSIQIDNITTPNSINSNAGDGTLSTNIPANAAWIRISGCYQGTTPLLSLIRTA